MSLGGVDLNLLVVMDAVMRERNVLRAGQSIGLSPSAVSHALARLRALLQDDLFVRTSLGMQPTSRALDVAPLVRDALASAELALGYHEFDPQTSDRQFNIAATDYMTAVVVPGFLRVLAEEAPSVTLSIVPATRIDLTAQIDVGRIDAALGPFTEVPRRLHAQLLFEEPDVLIVASDHPLAGSNITIENLSALPIFAVAAGSVEDGHLTERGLSRQKEMFNRAAMIEAFNRIGTRPILKIVQPHFLALPAILAGTTAVGIVPAALGELFRQSGVASVSRLPWEGGKTPVQMVWHERGGRDPAQMWLRAKLIHAAALAQQPFIGA